jgi:hypothetical protein
MVGGGEADGELFPFRDPVDEDAEGVNLGEKEREGGREGGREKVSNSKVQVTRPRTGYGVNMLPVFISLPSLPPSSSVRPSVDYISPASRTAGEFRLFLAPPPPGSAEGGEGMGMDGLRYRPPASLE